MRKTLRSSKPVNQRAVQLRQEQAPAEALLWAKLRNAQLGGFKFRRQHPIDRFIADFYCPACLLLIEIDGPIHDSQLDHDAERTAILNQSGRHVIRFTNDQIRNNIDQVLESILAECHHLKLSSPTHQTNPTHNLKRNGHDSAQES